MMEQEEWNEDELLEKIDELMSAETDEEMAELERLVTLYEEMFEDEPW